MSEGWLQSWLVGLNLSEYLDTLSQRGYTSPKVLASIVERDQLKAIGVTKMGHLNRLFRAIEKLRSDGDGVEDGGMPSVLPSLENHNSAPVVKAPPPVPKRKSVRRHAASDPISPTSPLNDGGQNFKPPPPVRPRDQSLMRRSKLQMPSRASTLSAGNILTPTPSLRSPSDPDVPAISTNGHTAFTDGQATSPTKPLAPGSPTPKPRLKHPPQPVPRKKSGSRVPLSSSASQDDGSRGGGGEAKAFMTLPAGVGLMEGNGGSYSQTSSPSLSPLPGELASSSDFSKPCPHPDVTASPSDSDALFALENISLGETSGGEGMIPNHTHPALPPKDVKPSAVVVPDQAYPALPSKDPGRRIVPKQTCPPGAPVKASPDSANLSFPPKDPRPQAMTSPHSTQLPKDPAPPAHPPLPPKDPGPPAHPPLPPKDPGPPAHPPLPPKDPGPSAHPPLPPKDAGPPSFAPPPLLPERMSSLSFMVRPPLPGKSATMLPSHPHQPPPFQRRLTPEERVSVTTQGMAGATPPKPPPRASTLPLQSLPDLEEGEGLGANHVSSPELSTYSQERPPDQRHDLHLPPPPTEDPPEPPQAYDEDSDDEEEEERANLVSIQSSRPPPGEEDSLLMTRQEAESSGGDTPFSSPMHAGSLIRQQISSSRIKHDEDDIIMMAGFPSESGNVANDPDYMNQDTIDDDIFSNSGSEDEEMQRGGPRRIIMSVKSDSVSDVIGMGRTNPDYMNMPTIDDELDSIPVQTVFEEEGGGGDYMNQEAIDQNVEDGGSDYINQEAVDQSIEDADMAIEYMNQAIIDLVHSEIEQDKAKGLGMDSMIWEASDSATRVTQVPVHDNDFYDTEDDLTDDFDDDGSDSGGDRLKVSTHKEPLQIRGTTPIKSHTLGPTANSNLDYENQDVLQDVLEGDIIPMLVASTGNHSLPRSATDECHSCLPSWSEGDLTAGQPLSYLEPKTKAEVSSNGQAVSPVSWNEADDGRASWCSNDMQSSSLDFTCDRPTKANKGESATSEVSRGGLSHNSSHSGLSPHSSHSGLSPNSSHSPTKPRAHTDAKLPPHPLTITSQSKDDTSAVPSRLEMDGFGSDPFNRDYIPPQLPKSAGTFCGIPSKKPDFRKLRSTDDQLLSRNSLFADRSANTSLTESTMLPGFSRLGSASAENVPKTKEGFLHKKGGRRSERPWQKRWIKFNGSELKYFKNKQDKDNLCLNTVELEKMIDVKKVQDEVDKQYRFDLVVINRVFQFFAESVEDCQEWVNVLHVAIAKFKPQDHEHKEGGSMHDPDKYGYLQKQGHGAFSSSKFKERYVALKGSKFAYYETQEHFKHGRPIHTLDMRLSSVRPDMTSKLPRFIIITSNQKHYNFQASTDLDRNQWVESLSMAIMTGLDLGKTLRPNGAKRNNSQVVLFQLQENFSNKTCADCAAEDPVWGVINRGTMVCIKCSGIHRSLGVHLSKVRSIELDEEIWTNQDQIDLMTKIGNDDSNHFWERHYQGQRLPADVENEIREEFIRAKYVTRSWIPRDMVDDKEVFNDMLCENVTTDDLMKTIELIALGADTCHLLSDVDDPDMNTPLAIARSSNQVLQAKLLEVNGASICRKEDRQTFTIVSKKGYLHKTGTDRTGWRRRYCSLHQHRGFEYFKSDTDTELQGYIRVEEMLSVAKSEDEGPGKDNKYRHCFEVNTKGRGYLFCADTAEELESWVGTFKQIIFSDAADNLGYDKVGYLKKKDPHNVTGWKRMWFTLKGKSLAYYRKEREEVDEIDLRKVMELKGPEASNSAADLCVIQIITEDKTYHLRAESLPEAESWMSALRHTQVSGIPMGEQQLTSTGIPIVIHKCLQFIESIGLDIEGLYRISGEKAKIRKLILAFNQDARGVVIDPEKYTVHDVTGTLKQFLHSLPDPVLTQGLYQNFIATIQSDHEAQMYQIKSLIEQLPPVNKETLKRIIGHLKRVTENEAKNKMSVSNITRLFGPTLMTSDDGPMSFANTQYEYSCVHAMIKFYKWLFQVAEEENKKDEAIEEAVMKIKELEEEQKKRAELKSQKISNITSTTDFLTTIYIGGRLGDTYNMHINGVSTVQGVVEEVVVRKELPPDNYALYLVLGDSESHRVLCFAERLLAVQCSAGTEHYLCLQRNAFWETLNPHFGLLRSGETVLLHVKEKKKWKKYPCCIRDNQFIQFKDAKMHSELFKLSLNEFDIFVGIQQSRIDIKNPMPTRHSFWIKATRGDDMSRYFCSDSKEDMLNLIAAVVQAKFPSCLKTPILPENSSPLSSPPAKNLDLEFGRPFNTSPPLRS